MLKQVDYRGAPDLTIHRRTIGSLLVMASMAAGLLAWQPTAFASNWGSGLDHACDDSIDSQCVARNRTVDVFFFAFGSVRRQDALDVFSDEYNNHSANAGAEIYLFEAQDYSDADAVFYDGSDLTHSPYNGKIAWTRCPSYADKGTVAQNMTWCEPQTVTYNNKAYPNSFDTTAERRAIACHEIGHIYGLRHRPSNYCMNDDPFSLDDLGTHDMLCLINNYPLMSTGREPCQ